MAAKRKDAPPPSWIPILELHDQDHGVRVYVNAFWVKTFTVGGRGTIIEFVGGSSIDVEESPEEIALAFGRTGR